MLLDQVTRDKQDQNSNYLCFISLYWFHIKIYMRIHNFKIQILYIIAYMYMQ